jgi:diguanylate cyclase (GGDEF)-like protein/PAS domain S-box-containing protein
LSDIEQVGWYDKGVGQLRGRTWRRENGAHALGASLNTAVAPVVAAPSAPSMADVSSFAGAMLKLPDSVVIVDEDGNVIWGNATALGLFGLSMADSVGISGLSLVHPDDHELVLRSLTTIQGKEVGDPIEIRVKSVTGWRLVEIVGTPLTLSGRSLVLLCLRDLTKRRRFELASGHEARFRSLVHNAGSVIMLVSATGLLESASGAMTRLLGHDPELIEMRPLTEIVAEPDRRKVVNALAEAGRGATATHPVTIRVELLRHDGKTTVPFELSIVDLIDDPTVEGFVISAHDASAQDDAEHQLGDALSLLTATLDSTADGILVIDTEGNITGYNRRFSEIWRVATDFVAIGDDATKLGFVLEQLLNPQAFLARWKDLQLHPENESFDTLEFKDGRALELSSRPQSVDDTIVGRVWSFRDVTDRIRLEDELEYRAFHDSLTGLANKALFQDRLEHALARIDQTGSHLAVLFVDLDDFKTVNDSLGHGEGDLLLKRVASKLSGCLRPIDTAARLGGDEFAVLVEDVWSREDITSLAGRILASLRLDVPSESRLATSAGSIGIAFDEPGITSEQLLRNADIAMYRAKASGKDGFEVYRKEMHTAVLARIEQERELRAAIHDGDLLAHYQPIYDLDTLEIIGFEALVRWAHPIGGLVDPRLFVPLAEELGLIGQIDSFVLRSACTQARQWHESGLSGSGLVMSVNLSPGQLVDPDLAQRIAGEVEACRFDPRSLVLEITESATLTDNETTVRNLVELRSLGVRIALDDFGTGYSSLSHLDRLQVDIVKIDKSFVQALGTGDDSHSLAAAMVQLAQTLGYETIGEGVENPVHQRALRAIGCRFAQGYHLGRPLNTECTDLLLASQKTRESVSGAVLAD